MADKQIDQMCNFIIQEAKEKAEEIKQKTEAEFSADRLSLTAQAGVAIRDEHERKKKDKITEQKIAKSQAVTSTRFATMRRRDVRVRELKRDVMKGLAVVSKNEGYAELLRFLIAQSLLTIQEDDVVVHGRKQDMTILEAQLPLAVKIFQDTIENATGIRPICRATLNKRDEEMLPPGPIEGKEGQSCCGGVKLSARAGKIVCRNTLDSRLDLCFKELKPQIREILFTKRAAPKKKAEEPKKHH